MISLLHTVKMAGTVLARQTKQASCFSRKADPVDREQGILPLDS